MYFLVPRRHLFSSMCISIPNFFFFAFVIMIVVSTDGKR
jgi:hypothetical protein